MIKTRAINVNSSTRRLANAVDNGLMDAAIAAMTAGADPNDASTFEYGGLTTPPLVRAVLKGFVNMVKLLLRNGAAVDAVHPPSGGTALHEAARLGQVPTAKLLLAAGAGVDRVDRQGLTPLQAASNGGGSKCGDMVRELIAAGARVDTVELRSRNTPLHVASKLGNVDVVERLLKGDADLVAQNAFGQTPLHLAAADGQGGVVACLVRAGADPNECDIVGRSPLYLAAVHGHAKVIGELARSGADPAALTVGGNAPLTAAAEEGQAKVVKSLLKLGIWALGGRRIWADALCSSARRGHCNVMQQLLQAGGSGGLPGAKFIRRTGTTPLHCAAAKGYLGAVRMLLEAGADENALNGAGFFAREVVGTRRPRGEEDPAEDNRIAHMLKHESLRKRGAGIGNKLPLQAHSRYSVTDWARCYIRIAPGHQALVAHGEGINRGRGIQTGYLYKAPAWSWPIDAEPFAAIISALATCHKSQNITLDVYGDGLRAPMSSSYTSSRCKQAKTEWFMKLFSNAFMSKANKIKKRGPPLAVLIKNMAKYAAKPP